MSRLVSSYVEALLAATADATEEKVRETVESLRALLRRRGHAALFPRVVAETERRVRAKAGIAVEVASATALSATEKTRVAEALGLSSGTVRWEERVDRALGAGARVRLGDLVADETLTARLGRLREAMG